MRFARKLPLCYEKALTAPTRTLATLSLPDATRAANYADEVLKGIVESAVIWNDAGAPRSWRSGEWSIEYDDIEGLPGKTFSEHFPSYTVVATAPFPKNEQHRFSARVTEKVENIAAHCPDVSAGETNVVAVKLPESISMQDAHDYLAGIWGTGNAAVSAVLLVRSRVLRVLLAEEPSPSDLTSESFSPAYLGYEVELVPNPMASYGIETFLHGPDALEIDVPPFSRQAPYRPALQLLDRGALVPVGSRFLFTRGKHFYEVDAADRAAVQAAVTPVTWPSIQVWSVMTRDGEIESMASVYHDRNELLLI